MGLKQQPNQNTTLTTLCLLLPPQAAPAAAGRELAVCLPLTHGAAGTTRPPWYQSDLSACSEAAAVPEPAQRAEQKLFYLQPADNRVEIDRSCRQQVTPCLSAPNGSSRAYSLDRSSLTLSGSAQDTQGCCRSPPCFYLCHSFMLLLSHCLQLRCF